MISKKYHTLRKQQGYLKKITLLFVIYLSLSGYGSGIICSGLSLTISDGSFPFEGELLSDVSDIFGDIEDVADFFTRRFDNIMATIRRIAVTREIIRPIKRPRGV